MKQRDSYPLPFIVCMGAVIIALLLVMNSCGVQRQEVTPQPAVVTDSDKCSDACNRLWDLGCEEAKPVKTGLQCNGMWECNDGEMCVDRWCVDTCEQFCNETQSAGVWLDPTCVSQIKSCEEVNSCPTTIAKP